MKQLLDDIEELRGRKLHNKGLRRMCLEAGTPHNLAGYMFVNNRNRWAIQPFPYMENGQKNPKHKSFHPYQGWLYTVTPKKNKKH